MQYITQIRVWSQDGGKQFILDLKDAEPVSLNFSFTDIKDFATKSSWSRQFRIPATEINAEVFGYMHESNVVQSSFNPKKKLRAQILVESIPIMSGHLQFKASYKQQGMDVEYEIMFFGDVLDFMKKVGDKDFKDTIGPALQNDYPLIMSFGQLGGQWQNETIQLGLTDRGNRWVGMVDDATTRSIYSWDMQDVIKFNDLTPFVNAGYIFRKIMEIAGCKINVTASTTLLDELDRIFIPWTSKANTIQSLGNPETAKFLLQNFPSGNTLTSADFSLYADPSGAYVYMSSLPLMTPVYDPGSNTSGNVYTVPFNGVYKIQAKIRSKVDMVGAEIVGFYIGFKIYHALTGVTEIIANPYTSQQIIFDSASGGYILNNYDDAFSSLPNPNNWEGTMSLNGGDTIEVITIYDYAYYSVPPLLPWGGTLTFDNASFFRCEYVEKPAYGPDVEIDWIANAPEKFKLSDFMKSFIAGYNLLVIPDKYDPSLVSFVPMMEYLDLGEYKDWTGKINLLKDVVIKTIADYQKLTNTWTYKESNDYLNNLYKVQGNRVYGRLELIDPENDFATDDSKTELQFAPTPLALIDGTDYPIPKFWNEKSEYVVPIPRILYQMDGQISIHMLDDTTNTVFNGVILYLFGHYTEPVPTLESRDLNFGQEVPLHSITSTPYKTLYSRFWNDYIFQLYSPESRIMEAYFDLDLSDIFAFKYNDIIFIQDAYWRILDISDYQIGTTESTKVTLMKIINVKPLCLNKPGLYINVDGSVPFVDPDGNPTAPTEECCTQYGYTWLDSKCYAVIRDGGNGKPDTSGKQIKMVQVLSSQDAKEQVGVITANNDIKSNNDNLLVNASKSVIEPSNSGSIVTGSNHIVEANNGAVIVSGDSAQVKNPGTTTGVAGDYRGEFQYGKMGLTAKGNLPSGVSTIAMYIDGIDGCKMPDDCVWSVRVQLTVAIVSGGITDTLSGEYAFSWQSVAGTCSEVGNNILSEITTYPGMTINFGNSSPSPGQMTMRFAVAGAPAYPIDVAIVGALNYTQYSYV